ncbi:hypothetical protein ILUMI_23706 [Ignelater luminosus]|uniref:YqaJ viral recombinase domain-containing protein n=1 Tax=Ignelater luminosus TaxID=2038154 RepID=A0A8K0G1D3_IGNLU|nr:hypothetical protein ILUMI_23706 [Ignelater luminosus]
MCDCEEHLATEKPQTSEEKSNNHSTINTAAVWGTLSTGGSYTHLTELLSVMNVPPLGGTVFFEIQRELDDAYEINSSSAFMEADIVIGGFNSSIAMHGLRYKKFIADGDSTVYSRIKQHVSYGHEVQKIECVNHCIKNYSKHFYRIKKDTKSVALETRKLLTNQRIKDLTRNAQKAIYANAHGDISQLKPDLQNSVPCSFGNHSKCRTYLCNHVGDTASDNMSQLLIDNETNNRAELFMSLLARFNMGKRLNLIQRDGFQMRSYLSALRYNVGQSWHHKSWKQYFKKSPSKILKTYMTQQEEKHRKRRNTIRVKHSAVKRLKFDTTNKENNRDYGLNISEVFMTTDEIKDETNKLLEHLKEKTGKTVERAGLYIDVDHGFLGASPDGVINKNEIIEVKCLYKVAQLGLSVQQAVERKCITCLEKDLQNKIRLRRNHDYFFQIQGHLAITGAEIRYFIVYTGDKNDIFIEEIKADKDIWNTIMLPKLIDFYVNCIAPNIIENRPGRGLQWKDPPSIIEAQNALRTKKEQTKQKRQE